MTGPAATAVFSAAEKHNYDEGFAAGTEEVSDMDSSSSSPGPVGSRAPMSPCSPGIR